MKDIVIVLAYWRPNYLPRCFECLFNCPDISNKEIWFFQDTRECLSDWRKPLLQQVFNIAKSWSPSRLVQRNAHDFCMRSDDDPLKRHACSFNSFWALREAYESGAKYVYLVADDVLVTPDFFKWHEAVQNDGDYFSTVAERAFRQYVPQAKPFDLSAYYRSPVNTMDGGICWKNDNLKLVVDYPNTEVRDHRFAPIPFEKQCPMIPYVQRAYHVGKVSSYCIDDNEHLCGDADDVPSSIPNYSWKKVYRAE